MRSVKKIEMDQNDYVVRYLTQVENKNGFSEQIIGSRKKLFVYNRLIASHTPSGYLDLAGLDKKQFASFLGQFSKKLYAQILKFPELLDIEIEFKGVAKHRNRSEWSKLPIGSFFFNIDLNSAYWQIARRLNYIDEKFFNQYIDLEEYKTAKRFCISFLSRPNKKVYHTKSGTSYTIECNTICLQNIYKNIRKELYKTIQGSLVGIDNYLEYNIDGVMVRTEHVVQVKEYFVKEGLHFKTIFCQKISNEEFKHGKKIKNFIRKEINQSKNQ